MIKCGSKSASRFDGFGNADKYKHITESKHLQHASTPLVAYHRKTLAENKK